MAQLLGAKTTYLMHKLFLKMFITTETTQELNVDALNLFKKFELGNPIPVFEDKKLTSIN